MSVKTFCRKVGESGTIELKNYHDCYFHVQGAMAITQRPWCDFVVRTPLGLLVKRTHDSEAMPRTSWYNFI